MKKLIVFLLATFLFVSTAEAALKKAQKFEYFNNTGGLNDKLSPISIKDSEASALQNVNFTLGGAIMKRKGYSSDNHVYLNGPVTGLYQYTQKDGTEYLVATAGQKIYKMDSLDGAFDDITSTLTIATGSTALFDFTIANNNLVATNQTNQVIKWTGSGNGSDLTAAPQGQWVEFHQNIVFMANTITDTAGASDVQPSRLYFSNVLDETTWTSTDYIDVGADDGSEITGLAVLLDTLYIFKENAIFRLSGTNRDDFVLSRMVNGVGCISGRSIQVINNRIIFQARDGIYVYDGGINVKKISARIEDTLDDLDATKNEFSVSANFKKLNQYWLSATTSGVTAPDLILVYDYYHDAWTKYTGIEANAMTTLVDTNDVEQLYTGDATTENVFKQNDGDNDDGVAIDAFYTTKWFRFPEIMESDKVVRLLRVFAKADGNWDLTVDSFQDFASATDSDTITLTGGGSLYGTGLYGTATYAGDEIIIGRIHLSLRESFFKWSFKNSNADEPFTVYGFVTYVEPQQRI